VDFAGGGEAGEAAIGAGDYVLLAHRLGEAGDALGDQLGMLDDVRGMGDDPGDESLAVVLLSLAIPAAAQDKVWRVGLLSNGTRVPAAAHII